MRFRPQAGLAIVEEMLSRGELTDYHLVTRQS